MKQSNLVTVFINSAWHLHAPIHSELDGLLRRHVNGTKHDGIMPSNEMFSINTDHNESDDKENAPMSDRDYIDKYVDNAIYYEQKMMLEREAKNDFMQDGIAVINMCGVLARQSNQVNGACLPEGRSYAQLISQLYTARDAGARAIVLRGETPGGMANGCEELNQAIRSVSASGVPVYGFVDGYCFSAGTYAMSACDSITLSSTAAHYGSIGTIMSTVDDSEAWAKEGYKAHVTRSGPYKALGQPGEEITDLAKSEMQRVCDAYATAFYDAVIAGRGLNDDQATAVLNGRTFTATEAIKLGLADHIADWNSFFAALITHTQNSPETQNKENTMQFFSKKENEAGGQNSAQTEGLSKDDFSALAEAYPKNIAQIKTLDAEGKNATQIENAILKATLADMQAGADRAAEAAAASAADDNTADAEAQAAADAEAAALTEENKELAAKVAKAEGFAAQINEVNDPGSDDDSLPENSYEALKAEWDADEEVQENFALYGFASYIEHKRMVGAINDAQAEEFCALHEKEIA